MQVQPDQDWAELLERKRLNPMDVVVVAWTRTSAGLLVWLEQGDLKAGLAHIIDQHGSQFSSLGISMEQLPELLMQALRVGRQVAMQRSRPVYQVFYQGRDWYVAIDVGDNGFVLGANPVGQRKLRQLLRRQNAPENPPNR